MKLLVHNFLSSRFLKNVNAGYPLKLMATTINAREQEFSPEFIVRMLPKLEYDVLRQAALSIGHGQDLPEVQPKIATVEGSGDQATASAAAPSAEDLSKLVQQYDENFLKAVHRNLLEIEIVEGFLECPETGRKFPIKNGIPNMLANEDEVK